MKHSVLWLATIVLFLLAGTLGHDPWKQDETYSFGIIYHFYTTQSWLVPMNAGTPFMEKPPLFYWTAVVFSHLFGDILPLHDAARLTSFFLMGITCVFLWHCAQILYNNTSLSWASLPLLLGAIGVIPHAHELFTDVMLLTGTTITITGIALLCCNPAQWKKAGVIIGAGIGIAFMSKGFIVPTILALSGLILIAGLPELRTRKTFQCLGVAFLVAAPFLLIWPYCLYQQEPVLFHEWFWNNNIGRFFGFSVARLGADNEPFYMIYTIMWFALPALPLAFWTLVRSASHWRSPQLLIPITIMVTGLTLLTISASGRALYLLPLTPAVVLLALPALPLLTGRFLLVWHRIAAIIFTVAALFIWLLWLGLLYPTDATHSLLQSLVGRWLPIIYSPPDHQWVQLIIAAGITFVWCKYLMQRSTASYLHAAYVWLAGMSILFGISHTLLMPWIEVTRSYRPILAEITEMVQQQPDHENCLGTYQLGESISPMVQYMVEPVLPTYEQTFEEAKCNTVLTIGSRRKPAAQNANWSLFWRGSRLLDEKDEELRLYVRR